MRAVDAEIGERFPTHRTGVSVGRCAIVLAALASLLLLLPAAVMASDPPKYVGSFGPDGTEATGFAKAGPIAVDQASDLVYVMDHGGNSILKFDLDGSPVPFTGTASYISGNEISGLSPFPGIGEAQVAVDPHNHNLYVTSGNKVRAFESSGEPFEFTAGPGAGTSEIGGFQELLGVAVDQDGTIYTGDYNSGTGKVRIFNSSGGFLTDFLSASSTGAGNLMVDDLGNLYVNGWGSNVNKFAPSTFPVTAATEYTNVLGFPVGSSSLAGNPVTTDVYLAEVYPNNNYRGAIGIFDEEGNALTTFAGPEQEGAVGRTEGVGVDGGTGTVFVADIPESGLSQIKIFRPIPKAPAIEGALVSRVTSDSAWFGGSINANTLQTSYHFEYGLGDCSVTACTGLPLATLGAGYSPVNLSLESVSSLQPSTTYHFRLVATNSLGTREKRGTFTTQAVAVGFTLPDSRAWELVSPPEKHGARLVNPPTGPMQAAEDGSALAYQSLLSIEVGPDGSRATERSNVLARRVGSGWESKDITPPHSEGAFLGNTGNEYHVFSPDLSSALLEPLGGYPLSEQASARTPYLRVNEDPPSYSPLVTAKAGYANVPVGTDFGRFGSEVKAVAATRDLNHVILKPEDSLFPSDPPSSLYEWRKDDGQIRRVSVLPVDEGNNIVAGMPGSQEGSLWNAISADGSRVLWSAGIYARDGGFLTALYLRDLDTSETVRIDTSAPDATGFGTPRPLFLGADESGRVVFFTDSQQLTSDASIEGSDLYRCELPPAGAPLACDLTNLTSSLANPGESARVLGVSPGGREDGTSLYFVARGVLDSDPNQAGESAVSGEPNLYLWQEGEGVRFISTLSSADSAVWGKLRDGLQPVTKELSASVSPSGRYLAFQSERNLTGYQNLDEATGKPVAEVFEYDAKTEDLVCVSCNPTGASPASDELLQGESFRAVDPHKSMKGHLTAALLPEARTSNRLGLTLYRPRVVLDNGRVFLNAFDSLVPADSNGQWDVYQYESFGVGDCSSTSGGAATVSSEGGCISLLSSGTAPLEAAFLDADASGDNVFFLSQAKLSATDVDEEYDVYDVRVGGTVAKVEQPAECQGEACLPAAAVPNDPTPGSATFRGSGDPRPRKARHCRHTGKRDVPKKVRKRCASRGHGKHRHSHKRTENGQGSGR